MKLRAIALGLFGVALSASCTSTLRLAGNDTDAGPTTPGQSGDGALSDANDDADALARDAGDLPMLDLKPVGDQAVLALILDPGTRMPLLSSSGSQDWPCTEAAIVVDATQTVAFRDLRIHNPENHDVTVRLALVGSLPSDTGVHRGDVGFAIYASADVPADRRLCRGVMKVDCIDAECGDAGTSPVTAALSPYMIIPANASYAVTIFGRRPEVYGPLAVVVFSFP